MSPGGLDAPAEKEGNMEIIGETSQIRIIGKVLAMAIKNGYNFAEKEEIKKVWLSNWNARILKVQTIYMNAEWNEHTIPINDIIFSHDFAKAFWGTETIRDKENEFPYLKADYDRLKTCERWQYHLQQMVLEDDPIKYLERFTRGGE